MIEDSEHLIGRIAAAWNAHDPAAIAALHAPEGTVEDAPLPPARGTTAIVDRADMFLRGLDPLQLRVMRVVAGPDAVGYEWRVSGQHAGPLLGISATGRTVEVSGVSLLELDRDGLILAERLYWDASTVLRQLTEDE